MLFVQVCAAQRRFGQDGPHIDNFTGMLKYMEKKLLFYMLIFKTVSLNRKFSIVFYGNGTNFFAMTQLTFRPKE
jgi:hypothetical protein